MPVDPLILTRKDHTISRKNIDFDALKVLYRLNKSRYKAYLVGGSVRDLMLGRVPKDFDVVTNARPNQVKMLFRNSYLVGRRFRLVHVKFGSKIIEVSTFRRQPVVPEEQNGDLMVRHENTFGTPQEDAYRRDFTINGLFYDIGSFCIIDYVGGLSDLTQRIVRTIGNADLRFQEDPVRMIRAIRVAARIGFSIDPDGWNAILNHRSEVMKCSSPRLLEELFHLLKHGSAAESMKLMYQSGLMEEMIPELYKFWKQNDPKASVSVLEQLDRCFPFHPHVTPPVILAAAFFPLIQHSSYNLRSGIELRQNVELCLRPFARSFSLPRAYLDRATQICIAQRWFSAYKARHFKPAAFIQRDFFPETLTLFSLRSNGSQSEWQQETERWIELIRKVPIKQAYRQQLLRILSLRREPVASS